MMTLHLCGGVVAEWQVGWVVWWVEWAFWFFGWWRGLLVQKSLKNKPPYHGYYCKLFSVCKCMAYPVKPSFNCTFTKVSYRYNALFMRVVAVFWWCSDFAKLFTFSSLFLQNPLWKNLPQPSFPTHSLFSHLRTNHRPKQSIYKLDLNQENYVKKQTQAYAVRSPLGTPSCARRLRPNSSDCWLKV